MDNVDSQQLNVDDDVDEHKNPVKKIADDPSDDEEEGFQPHMIAGPPSEDDIPPPPPPAPDEFNQVATDEHNHLTRADSGMETSRGKRAFTLMRFVRKLVSKKKKRIQELGYDLDMTYITDRIIAMGFPTSDDSFQSKYRNPFSEVYKFLEEFHHDHYKVYNLCSERKYDAEKFHGRVGYYPFDDHNCPRFDMILQFCQDAKDWLDKDEANIVAVHCKAGKGRTGLMISALMVYAMEFESADKALEFYGTQRTTNGKGVTLPSQIRYVGYFYNYLHNYLRVHKSIDVFGVKVKFKKLTLSSVPHFDPDKGSDPYILMYGADGSELHDTRSFFKPMHLIPNKKHPEVDLSLEECSVLSGDINFVMYDYDQLGNDDKMCYFWINTAFLPAEGSYLMKKDTIDVAHKDKKSKHFDKHWTLTLVYEFAN